MYEEVRFKKRKKERECAHAQQKEYSQDIQRQYINTVVESEGKQGDIYIPPSTSTSVMHT